MKLFNIKIDDIYDVTIEALENDGLGVAKVYGMVVFVPKTLIGEKVRIRITEIKKNFARGKVIEIIEPSSKREESLCPYYNECGGCNLRHQSDLENLNFKKNKVENAIKRIGKIDALVNEVIPCIKAEFYRNKASFKVENDRIGFYINSSYQLVDIKECRLLDNDINNALGVIRNYLKENDNCISSVVIKKGSALNELLIDIYSVDENDSKILNYLINNIYNLKTVIFNDLIIYGTGYISQITNGLMFNCSAKSFFQVNEFQTEILYKEAIKKANLNKDDTVLDLYCGTGTITSIISRYVKKVIGIEIVSDAIIDAKNNLKINNINNVEFICGDAAKEINKIKEKIDVIFVDPPRAGIDRKAIALIKKISPKKIIYISCNPVTLARDLNYLNDLYNIVDITPVDMFPKTAHVECVSVLHRKSLEK